MVQSSHARQASHPQSSAAGRATLNVVAGSALRKVARRCTTLSLSGLGNKRYPHSVRTCVWVISAADNYPYYIRSLNSRPVFFRSADPATTLSVARPAAELCGSSPGERDWTGPHWYPGLDRGSTARSIALRDPRQGFNEYACAKVYVDRRRSKLSGAKFSCLAGLERSIRRTVQDGHLLALTLYRLARKAGWTSTDRSLGLKPGVLLAANQSGFQES